MSGEFAGCKVVVPGAAGAFGSELTQEFSERVHYRVTGK